MTFLIILTTIICFIAYLWDKELTLFEFIKTVAITNTTVLIIYTIALIPFNNDKYFASGRLVETVYHPPFIEQYQQAHTRCTGSGKTEHCYTYYTTEYDHHRPYWTVRDSLNQKWGVESLFHSQVKSYFGNNKITTRPNKCTHGGHYISGDPYLYTYKNETNTYKYPTTKKIGWHNPFKNSDSLFNESSDFKISYPKKLDDYRTNRLITNKGSDFLGHDWDVLNTKLYSIKRVNIIAVQVKSLQEASKLEACWTGGEMNDLVICVVGTYNSPEHVKVFGWTKESKVKIDLAQLILDEGLKKQTFPKIINVIKSEYEPMNFSEFKYIHQKPPTWAFIISTILASIICYFCIYEFRNNYERR